MAAFLRNLDNLIEETKVVIIAKSYCGYCLKAKKILKSYVGKAKLDIKNDYKAIDIDIDEPYKRKMNQIQSHMEKKTGGRSVPRVFINGKSVGGCSDLETISKDGRLAAMLDVTTKT